MLVSGLAAEASSVRPIILSEEPMKVEIAPEAKTYILKKGRDITLTILSVGG